MNAQTLSARSFKEFAPAAMIVAAVLIAYVPALRAGFIWDDDYYVTKNVTLRDAAGLKRIWIDIGATPQYYPLVFTSFWFERQLWGIQNAAGYHLTNVLLHAANALLVWLVLRRLKIPGAWLAATLFALHPVQVESVAWITERKNVLSGMFYLGALLAYFRFCGIDHDAPGERRGKFYLISLVLFTAALLSKTVTCTLPAVIALILWWKKEFRWRNLLPLVPMILLGLAAGALTATMERHHVGAQGPEWDLSIVDRTLIAGRAVWFYAFSILAPVNLTFIYPRWHIDAGQLWQYFFPVAAFIVVGWLWFVRRKWGHGPLVAALFFVITLSPALGFVNVYPMLFSFVADHFQYLAGLGLIVPIASVATRLCAQWSRSARAILLAIVTVCLITITWHQALMYRDARTLWTETLRRNPKAWIAHNNLSEPLLAQGDFSGAAQHAEATLDLRPNYARAHNNLGLALQGLGHPDEAAAHFRKAIELDPALPQARLNLAEQLMTRNDFDGAEREYAQAIEYAPDFADAHYNYAVLLAMRGRNNDALRESRTACALNPDDAQSQLLLRKLTEISTEKR